MKRGGRFPEAKRYMDCRGKLRWRFRPPRGRGFTRDLGTAWGSPEFIERYEAALAEWSGRGRIGADRTLPGTFNELIVRFKVSPEFLALAPSSRRSYGAVLETLRAEIGRFPFAKMLPEHVKALLARRAATPAAANIMRKRLHQLFVFAGLNGRNPVKETRPYTMRTGGFHTWTDAEIAAYRARHPLGSTPRLAFELMLCTGAARVDAVALGWGNVSADGRRISYRREKMKGRDGELVNLPILAPLAAALALVPRDRFTFLETAEARSRTPAGLGGSMREWCDQAGLPACTAHGLRKALARTLAENRATVPEIMAALGHKTPAEALRYAREADKARLADSGMERAAPALDPSANVANVTPMFAKKPRNRLKRKGD